MKEKQELINNVSGLEKDFWNRFYQNEDGLALIENSDSGHSRFISYTYDDQRRLEREWNEEGFYLYFTDCSGSDLIDWLWKNKNTLTNDYLTENYTTHKIFLKTQGGKSIIEFKLMDIPIGDLLIMDDGDKSYYGELIYKLEFEYNSVIKDAIDQYNYEQSGAMMRSPEETLEYLSDRKLLIPLFDKLREHLKSSLGYCDLGDGDYMYWCGRYCQDEGMVYFNNFKSFCRKHDLDWQATIKALEKLTGAAFSCECELVNRFEGDPEHIIEEHWKSSEIRNPAS